MFWIVVQLSAGVGVIWVPGAPIVHCACTMTGVAMTRSAAVRVERSMEGDVVRSRTKADEARPGLSIADSPIPQRGGRPS